MDSKHTFQFMRDNPPPFVVQTPPQPQPPPPPTEPYSPPPPPPPPDELSGQLSKHQQKLPLSPQPVAMGVPVRHLSGSPYNVPPHGLSPHGQPQLGPASQVPVTPPHLSVPYQHIRIPQEHLVAQHNLAVAQQHMHQQMAVQHHWMDFLKPMTAVAPIIAQPVISPVGPRMWRGAPPARGHRFNPLQRPYNRFHGVGLTNDPTAINGNFKDPADGSNIGVKTIEIEEKKRKPMSKWYPAKAWNKQDAEKALKVELEAYKKHAKTLLVRFPDPEVSRDLIKSYATSIEKVHFQVPSGARYCFIQLSEESDVDKTIQELNEIDFYNLGKIKVERKCEKPEEDVTPETIDPYTLYVGNLPLNISTSLVKEKFPTSARIDVGFAQRMKYTRYAFVRYQTVEESIAAFQKSQDVVFDSRTLIVRFRRQKGPVSVPAGQDKSHKKLKSERRKKIQQDLQLEDLQKKLQEKIKKEKRPEPPDVKKVPALNKLIGDDEIADADIMESDDEEDDDEEDEEEEDEQVEEEPEEEEEEDKEEDGEEEDDDTEEEEEDEDEDEDDVHNSIKKEIKQEETQGV